MPAHYVTTERVLDALHLMAARKREVGRAVVLGTIFTITLPVTYVLA